MIDRKIVLILSIHADKRLRLRCLFSLLIFICLLADRSLANEPTIEEVKRNLSKILPIDKEATINKSPISELFEVTVGGKVFYVSTDLNYFVRGDLIDLRSKKNLTEQVRRSFRARKFASIERGKLITFTSTDKYRKAEIYVFTDIDCGYCRKFHLEVPALNDAGVTVHYLAFPRKGIDSFSSKKSESVWCSVNSEEALTNAKLGRRIKTKACENPIIEQFQLGLEIGVMGTPAVYSSDGLELGGYLSAEDVLKEITK